MVLRLRKCLKIIHFYIVSVAYRQMFVMVPFVRIIEMFLVYRHTSVHLQKTVQNGIFLQK